MLIEFLLLLLLYQLTGDCLLQFDRIIFKRKIDRFTLLEQFVFALIFGFLINTVFTVLIIYVGPFDLFLFLILDFLFLLIIFIVNKRSFQGFFYWRIYENIKNKKKSTISRHYYTKFVIFFIGIIFLNVYYRSFNYQLEFIDLLSYTHYALDSIRNGWNVYEKAFFFDINNPYTTQIFTFTIIPFYAISPSQWLYISGVYLSQLQLFLFFTMIYVILYKFDSKFNLILVFFISTAIVIFPTWYTYFLPTNFSIILFLAFITLAFNKNMRSLFNEVFLLFFILIYHIPSTIAVYSIPLIIILIIILYKEPEKLISDYYKKKSNIKNFIKSNKIILLIGTLILACSAVILIILNFSFIASIVNKYMSLELVGASMNTLILWRETTIGLIFNIFLLLAFLYLFRYQKIKKYKYQILFFFLLNLYLTIYLTFFDIFNKIIKTLYAEFRFTIYLDVSIIILVPILFSILIKNTLFFNKYKTYIKRRIITVNNYLKNFNLDILHLYYKLNQRLKRKRIKIQKYINISNIVNFSLFLLILSYSVCRAIPNYDKRYYHRFFEEFWYDSYYAATNVLSNIALGYETYIYNRNSPFSHLWAHMHTYLGDLRCINFDQMKIYYYDWLYSSNNSNYKVFLNFVFNDTKFINKKQANYKNLPIYLKIAKKVDYILIDNFTNPNLCRLMLNDTYHFTKLFQCRMVNLILLTNFPFQNLQVFLFKSKS